MKKDRRRSLLNAIAMIALAVGCGSHNSGKLGGGLNTGAQNTAITLTGSATVHDLAIPNGSPTAFLRIIPASGGSTLSGIVSSYFGDGDILYLRNDTLGTDTLTLTHLDTTSAVANEFTIAGATAATQSVVLQPHQVATIEYDGLLGLVVMSPNYASTDNGPKTFAGAATVNGLLTANGSELLGSGSHMRATGSAANTPVLSSCGSTPSIVGTDAAGYVIPNTTTCTITFATSYGSGSAAECQISPQGSAVMPNWSMTGSAITMAVVVSGEVYDYSCIGLK
jgi:hypothetical protein